MKIRVLIADDQALVRDGLTMIVQSQEDMTVVGQAGDGESAISTARKIDTDVVLMDISMPVLDGIEATRHLRRFARPPKVVMLTTFDLDEHAFAALRAGAHGFLLKSAPAEAVLDAIRSVHRGEAVVAPSTTKRLLDHVVPSLPGPATLPPEVERLTSREREVMMEIATGASNATIAERMFLSEATVKTYVGRLLTKLNLRDRVQVAVFAYQCGLVRPVR